MVDLAVITAVLIGVLKLQNWSSSEICSIMNLILGIVAGLFAIDAPVLNKSLVDYYWSDRFGTV